MRVLLLADVSLHRVIGGAERVLHEEASGLVRRGHKVVSLTRKIREHEADSAMIGGIREVRYALSDTTPLAFLRSTLINGKRRFEALQAEYGFDCLHGHQPFTTYAAWRSPAGRPLRKIYTCHSLSFEEYITRNRKPATLTGRLVFAANVLLRRRIEQSVLRTADRILVLSRFTRDKLTTTYGVPENRIDIVPGGVDLQRFFPCADKAAAREALALPPEAPILFTVRNLVPRMGLENLISAMRHIVKTLPETLLVIGGKGPLRESLESQVGHLGLAANVRFAGFIPEADLPKYFGVADAFVLPTVALEGFGLVTVEALACGVPTLGTPIGGTVEILEGLDPNFLFASPTPDDMAGRIISLLSVWRSDPAGYNRLSKTCRDYAETRYSWERHLDATERILAGSSAQREGQ